MAQLLLSMHLELSTEAADSSIVHSVGQNLYIILNVTVYSAVITLQMDCSGKKSEKPETFSFSFIGE